MASIVVTAAGQPYNIAVPTVVQVQALPSGSAYFWEFLDKPEGSAAVFANPLVQTTTFTVDVEGSYFIRVTVDGFDVGQIIIAAPFLTDHGPIRVPAAGETFEVDNAKGWARAVQAALRIGTLAYNVAQQNALTRSAKNPVRGSPDVDVPLTGAHPLTADGVTYAHLDRALLRNQAAGAENGIYLYEVSGGTYTLTRADDADTAEKLYGAMVAVLEGTISGDEVYLQLTEPIVLETTPIVWATIGAVANVVAVPTGSAYLIDLGATRVLRWVDGPNTYEVELSLV